MFGHAGIFYVVLSSLLSDDIRGRAEKLPLVYASTVALVVSAIGMLVDLRLSSDLTEEETGPLALSDVARHRVSKSATIGR